MHRQVPASVVVAAGVERHGDAFGAVARDPGSHAARFAHCERTDHDAVGAGCQQGLDLGIRTHAAAGLDPQAGFRFQSRQQWGQGVTAGARRIQVDQVQPFGTGFE